MLTVAGGCELVHIWQLKLGHFITCKISIAEADICERGDFWNSSNIGTAEVHAGILRTNFKCVGVAVDFEVFSVCGLSRWVTRGRREWSGVEGGAWGV